MLFRSELLEDEISAPAAAEPSWNTLLCDPAEGSAPHVRPRGPQPVVFDEFDPTLSFRDAKERAIGRWEAWYVGELLRHTRGNLSEAARVAHSDRSHLRKLVRKHLRNGRGGAAESEIAAEIDAEPEADGDVDTGD